MKEQLNLGMIGYKFMGKAHAHAWRTMPMFFDLEHNIKLKTVCGRDENWVRQASEKMGFSEYQTDWEKVVSREDIDIIDITTPSNFHKEIAIAAAENGKHIFCEKPLAISLKDSREMLSAVEKNHVKNQIGFNYRFAPAVVLAKKIIDEGRLGKIYHFRGCYLQDWILDPDFPKVWRLDKTVAGSGSHGDLGAHVIDMARFLVGELKEVIGHSKTFITERPVVEKMMGLSGKADSNAKKATVDVDDATTFLAEFENGAMATFEATRFSAGHKNDMYFEINGSKGSIKYVFERMNELQYFSNEEDEGLQGFKTIGVTEGMHPYMEHWWPAGHVLGYEHTFVHEFYEFYRSITFDTANTPSFYDGVKCSQILEAVDLSIANRQWIKVSDI